MFDWLRDLLFGRPIEPHPGIDLPPEPPRPRRVEPSLPHSPREVPKPVSLTPNEGRRREILDRVVARTPDQPLSAQQAAPISPAALVPPPDWWTALPGDIVFFDVETTGLHSDDRIVSIGMIRWVKGEIWDERLRTKYIHLICDPGKRSHPRAFEVHGHDDWLLRHQVQFSEIAGEVSELLDGAALLVAHNAEFDCRFLRNAFRDAGVVMPELPVFCTMQEWRRLGLGGAGLGNVLARIGLDRESTRHGALEDAWFCMQTYLRLRTPLGALPFSTITTRAITNLKDAPPRPDGPLPRRKRKSKTPANPSA